MDWWRYHKEDVPRFAPDGERSVMKASPSQVRAHRILGCLAVLHGLLVAIPIFTGAPGSIWFWWFWLLLATQWFFWPLVLAIHPGRSLFRIILPLILAYPGYFLWSSAYSNVVVRAFHLEESLPWGVDLSPHSVLPYAFAYGVGWADAKKDAKAGRLILESYGFGTITPGAPEFSDSARQQYGIEINQVAGCVVNVRIMGHAKGYNDATIKEIKRRFGGGAVAAAEEEEVKRQEEYEGARQTGRTDAENDVRASCLAIEVFGSPIKGEADYARMLRERYQIELRRVSPDTVQDIDNKVMGHASGYNEVSEAEIERRLGKEAIEAVRFAPKLGYENPAQ